MKKLLFIAVLLVSVSIFGQEHVDSIYIPQYSKEYDEQGFFYATSSPDGKKYYLKIEKTQKLFDTTIMTADVWVKLYNSSKAKSENEKITKTGRGYYLEYMSFDCIGKMYSRGEILQYDSKGRLINTNNTFSHITRKVVPGTVNEGLYEAVCRRIN
ncbi:surface-adhesin E family protein [Chryseobacterium sp. M5A1_1a]